MGTEEGSKSVKSDPFAIETAVEAQLVKEAGNLKVEVQKALYEKEKQRRVDLIDSALVRGKELKNAYNKANKPSTELTDMDSGKTLRFLDREGSNKLKQAKETYNSFMEVLSRVMDDPTAKTFQKLEERLKKAVKD